MDPAVTERIPLYMVAPCRASLLDISMHDDKSSTIYGAAEILRLLEICRTTSTSKVLTRLRLPMLVVVKAILLHRCEWLGDTWFATPRRMYLGEVDAEWKQGLSTEPWPKRDGHKSCRSTGAVQHQTTETLWPNHT